MVENKQQKIHTVLKKTKVTHKHFLKIAITTILLYFLQIFFLCIYGSMHIAYTLRFCFFHVPLYTITSHVIINSPKVSFWATTVAYFIL